MTCIFIYSSVYHENCLELASSKFLQLVEDHCFVRAIEELRIDI
jgi:hypothetical protein